MKTWDYQAVIQRAVHRQLNAVCRYIEIAAEGTESEGVHQSRVACRRLLSAVGVFKPAFTKREIRQWKTRFRGLTAALGQARDIDMQIAYLQNALRRAPAGQIRRGLRAVIAGLVRRRQDEQPAVRAAVDTFRRASTVEDMRRRLDALPRVLSAYPCSWLYAKQHKTVARRVKILRSYRMAVADPHDHHALHQLRIAAKRVRFALEYYQPFYERRLSGYVTALRAIQKKLGAVHDADVRLEILFPELRRQHGSDTAVLPALVWLEKESRAQRRADYDDFYAFWRKKEDKKFFQRLKTLTKEYAQRYRR